MGQPEPYWRTNISFSPPPSRWDFSFSSEELLNDSQDGNLLLGSSTSSNSKESGWMRGNHLYNHHCSASDGVGLFLSSPHLSPGPQWTPPAIQEINVDDYDTATRRGQVLQQSPSTPIMKGISGNLESGSPTSSFSDSSESEPTFKSCLSSRYNFSGRHSFLSKPIHPLFLPSQSPREASETPTIGVSEVDFATLQKDAHRWSSASSSMDCIDISDPLGSENLSQLCPLSDGYRCGLCERFLSQRSPWSSRRIVRSGDMPVAGVLSCHHVFHAECLEQTTSKAHKSDPPCPLCARLEEENSPKLRFCPRMRNSFPSLKPSSEHGSSRAWGCVPMGDCVEGALNTSQRNAMLLLNRSRMRKNLSVKGNTSKEFPGKLRNGTYSSPMQNGKSIDLGTVSFSMTKAGPTMKS
ncbi:hypothetical protein JCGZ_15625 [Jatropha curcas]|uniref:RING-type domain-containing protein n=1 Tax=Jatropha curcas TaxID=180498 RepID=A0A067L214_JATCU|nr:hypothetical protein JCGZ_15625 [Jatropha curcas]